MNTLYKFALNLVRSMKCYMIAARLLEIYKLKLRLTQ